MATEYMHPEFPLSRENTVTAINLYEHLVFESPFEYLAYPHPMGTILNGVRDGVNATRTDNPYIKMADYLPEIQYCRGFGIFTLASYIQTREVYSASGKTEDALFRFPAVTIHNFTQLAEVDLTLAEVDPQIISATVAQARTLTEKPTRIQMHEVFNRAARKGAVTRRRGFTEAEPAFCEVIQKQNYTHDFTPGAADAKALLVLSAAGKKINALARIRLAAAKTPKSR